MVGTCRMIKLVCRCRTSSHLEERKTYSVLHPGMFQCHGWYVLLYVRLLWYCTATPNYISTYGWNLSPPQYLCGLQSQWTWKSQHEEVRTFPIPLRLRIELNSSDIPIALATNIHYGCITNIVFCLCHSVDSLVVKSDLEPKNRRIRSEGLCFWSPEALPSFVVNFHH